MTSTFLGAAGCSGDDGDDTVSADGGDDNVTDTGTDPPEVCPPNRVEDESFEGGSPNDAWEEDSFLYDSLICDASCVESGDMDARTGDHAVWFGGIARTEVAQVRQRLDLPAGSGRVTFWLGIDTGPQRNGEDRFVVRLDDTVLFETTEAETDLYPAYTEVEIELSVPAGLQTLTFEADLSGKYLTSFFVDDVAVTVCADPDQPPDTSATADDGGTETGGTGTGGTDTGGTAGTGDTGTGTGTGTDGTGTGTDGSGTGTGTTSTP